MLALGALLAAIVSGADAYELRTHGEITDRAFDAAQFLAGYLDEAGVSPDERFDAQSVTPRELLGFFVNDGTPRGWMIEGAIREDDFSRNRLRELLGCPAPRNPPSAIDRPIHHFFDVQRGGGGLSAAGGFPAPDWALGLQGRGPDPDQNQFSLPDARVYQLRSLTEPTRTERERNTARLFRALGQVVHVLQDMAQPQHTRGDVHAGCLQFFAGETSWYEAYAETRATGVEYRSRADASRPLVLSGYAPVRFGAYRDYWANPGRTGVADFSSRSFFSAGTNLGSRSLAGPCRGLAEPVCDPQVYATENVDFSIPTITGEVLTGQVRFFLRDITDPVTGEVIPRRRVSSRSLWDQHLETRQQQRRFSLNTFNYDAMADVLLPRAVGYSAGLLDYFFRGRLDGDVVEDPADPSVVRFDGANASPEAMEGGTLELYAESAAGQRSKAVLLDTSATVSAGPGEALRSARFQAPADAERFVAVYKGKLGNELPGADPEREPGAVIGKVLGGSRVEHVYADGATWKLRTPQGIFTLPIATSEVEDLRWGDADNTLVGRSPLQEAPGSYRFFAWEIQRPVGSGEVPVEGGVVQLSEPATATFPLGLNIETTLELVHTIQYQQRLVSFELTQTLVDGTVKSSSVGGGQVETPITDSRTLQASWPVTLDRATLFAANFRARPYRWALDQIGLTADGRIVAVVEIRTTQPPAPNDVAIFASKRLASPEAGCSFPCPAPTLQEGGPVGVLYQFPAGAVDIVAVVDVTRGELLYSTAPPTMSFSHATRVTRFDERQTGGAFGGTFAATAIIHQTRSSSSSPGSVAGYFYNTQNNNVIVGGFCSPTDQRTFVALNAVAIDAGTVSLAAIQYKPEIAAVDPGIVTTHQVVAGRACVAGDADAVYGFALSTDVPGLFASSINIDGSLRTRSGPERLVLLLIQENQFRGRVIAWDPATGTVAAAQDVTTQEAMNLWSASHDAALIVASTTLTYVSLRGDTTPRVFPTEFERQRDFVVLEPGFLYDRRDTRFYRTQPPLQATALPLRLVPGGSPFGVQFGDYHTVKLR